MLWVIWRGNAAVDVEDIFTGPPDEMTTSVFNELELSPEFIHPNAELFKGTQDTI